MKVSSIDFSYSSPARLVVDIESFYHPRITNKVKKFFGKYENKSFTDNSYFTLTHSLEISLWEKFLIENACPILTNRRNELTKKINLSSYSIIDSSTVKEVLRKYELFYFNTFKMDKTISLQSIKKSQSIRDKYEH